MGEITKPLKRLIRQFRDRFQGFESIIPWDRFVEGDFRQNDVDRVRELILLIGNDYHELRNLLRCGVRDTSRLTGLKPDEQKYFREVIEERKSVFSRIFLWRVFSSEGSDVDWLRRDLKTAEDPVSCPEGESIRKTFDFGLTKLVFNEEELRDDDLLDRLDLEGARELVESTMFRPDLWHCHVESIRPVLLGKYPAVHSKLRLRLDDLYKSFIFGQYLSGIAMARSVLEYALATWANKRGLRIRNLNLEELIELVAEKEPSLSRDRLDIVRLNGNAIMHPEVIAHDNVIEFPPNQKTCRRCIEIVVETIETLQSDLSDKGYGPKYEQSGWMQQGKARM
jgi:hypothetical protein